MWDEPSAKATFALEVLIPEGESAYSNMPVASTQPDGEKQRIRFATSPRMSSYLLFLAVGDLERISQTVAGVDVGVVTRKGAGPPGATRSTPASRRCPGSTTISARRTRCPSST